MIGNALKNSKAPEKRPACDLLGQFARAGTTLDERTCSGRISWRRHTRHEAPLTSLEELKRSFKERLVKTASDDSPCS